VTKTGDLVRDVASSRLKTQREEEDSRLSDQELVARRRVIDEAKAAGATLHKPDARGGLLPSLVLGTLRRDAFQCKRCGSRAGIGPHHKGGIVSSARMSRAGHQDKLSNVVTLCAACHDREHEDARADGVDSTQVLPSGDVGTDRDRADRSAGKTRPTGAR
jgi:cytochrome c553